MQKSYPLCYECIQKISQITHTDKIQSQAKLLPISFFAYQKNSSKTWATVHDIIGKKKEGSAIPKVVINQVTNLANICDEFNKFFASVAPKMADRLPLSNFRFDHYMTYINQCESFFLQPVCEDEIET